MNPKTKKDMKQISKILSIAALFAMGATIVSCNSQKVEPEDPTPGTDTEKTVTVTSTVGLEPTTKALTALGAKTFAADETIAVFYTNESSELVKTTYTFTSSDIIDGGRKAAITISMTGPLAGGAMKYIYPAAMANADGTVNYDALNTQDGTLATLAASLDLATYDGTLTGEAALPESVTLSNQLAIGEFTIKNWGGTGITTTLTGITVTDGENTYTVTPAGETFASSPVYVAMKPVTDDKVLTFTATDGTKNYFKAVTGKALDRNNMYPVNLTMNTLIDLSSIDVSGQPEENGYKYCPVSDGDALKGTLSNDCNIYVPADATVTLAGMTHHAGENYNGITCLGTANIILAAGTTNNLTRGHNDANNGILLDFWGDATLTIGGTGTLVASGGDFSAGIGGIYYDYNEWSGDSSGNHIVINGGNITATGGSNAPGIGSSDSGKSGNITISGGTVYATGGNYAPGIGTGFNESHCGTITFSGGTTVATGGDFDDKPYYGIGAGAGHDCSCGDISFTNGAGGCSVTANGGVWLNSRYGSVFIDGNEVKDESLLWGTFIYSQP